MILHTSIPTEIIQELEKDLEWIHASAKKKAKKLKLKIIASGITNKEAVDEYTLTSPLNNRWFVTTSFRLNRATPLHVMASCAVESEFGTPDHLMLRGLSYGGRYYVRITSHTVSRMKERDERFKNMCAGQIVNRIFPHGEDGMGVYTREEDIAKTLEELFEKKDGRKNLFMATSTGIFFGFKETLNGRGNVTIKTFVTPDMLYTHQEQNMLRFCEANIRLQKHMKTIYRGKNAFTMIDNSPESTELIKVIEEYKSEMILIPEVVELPR